MPRLMRKLAVLCKIETGYGIVAAPAAADAIIGKNVTFTPLEATEISRDLVLPYLGNQGMLLTGKHAKLEMDVELAGAGAAGTVPKYSSILRACGFAETILATTSVTYSIVEDAVSSATIYFEIDGVRHVMVGSRGTLTMTLAPLAIPTYRFSMTGLLGTITDQALTAVAMTGWQKPLEPSSANTTMSLHAWAATTEQLTVTLGNTVTPRFLIGSESVIISDRKVTGSAVVEATSLATINWFDRAINRTRGPLSLVHGKTAGNIVEISGPAVEIGKPTQGEKDGILNYTLPLSFCPTTARDELSIIIR